VSASTALRSLLADRRGETEAVLALVRRIVSSHDVDEILDEAARLIARLTGSAGALIYLLDEDTDLLWVRAGVEGYEEWIGRFSIEIGSGLTGWTALNRTPAIVQENARDDPRYLFVPELNDEAFQSALTYPMISPADRLVGVVTLHTTAPHEFTEDDLTLVAPIASLVAAAVETAQLYADRTRQLDAVRALATAVEDPGSPAGRRRALFGLAESARALVGADAALVALRDRRGRWSLGAVSSPDTEWRRPERIVRPELLDPLTARVTRLSRARHGDLIGGLPQATAGVAVPLRAGAEVVGVLICLGRHARVAQTVLDVLAAIAAMTGQVVLNARLIDQVAGRNAEREFLEALAAGDEPEAVLAARARRLGIDLSERHVCVVLDADEHGHDPESALARACEAIRTLFPGSACAMRGLQAQALVRVRDERALAERLARAARGKVPIAVGIGEALDEAEQAVRMGRALHGPTAVTRFQDLGVQRYLWSLAQEPARDVWQERLERLRLHDAEHGSRLFETVERYLECNGNRKDAAARLFVHRNTLRQRVERIRRVAQIDLDDQGALFDLQVALRIVRYRDVTGPRRAHGTSS
jgi:sugar diacid utilization regulator/putative methionine-R-sulfoxide reductase with GAF domain